MLDVETRRERQRRYYAANLERVREQHRRYRAAHPEKARERDRARKREWKSFLRGYKIMQGCKDCGTTEGRQQRRWLIVDGS